MLWLPAINNCIRRVIWEDAKTTEYHQFEFLTGYENLEFNGIKFWNSMDYIIVDEPEKRDIYIPGFMKVPGYELHYMILIQMTELQYL